jgi:hypothetical protein
MARPFLPFVAKRHMKLSNKVLRLFFRRVWFAAFVLFPFVPFGARADTIPIVTQEPISVSVSVGSSAEFYVNASGSANDSYHYLWYKDGAPIVGQIYSNFNKTAELGDAGTYTVNVTDAAGSTMSSAATLTVQIPLLPKPSSIGSFQTVVAENQLYINSSFNLYPSPPELVQWFKDGQPIPGANSRQYGVSSAQASDAGTYVEVDGFIGGSIAQAPVLVGVENATNPNNWIDSGTEGGIAYFLFSNPAEVLRYDMNTGSWLSPVMLNQSEVPTAMAVLPEGIYISFGRFNFLYSLDLSTSTQISNAGLNTVHIFSNSTYVYLVAPTTIYSGQVVITSIDRSDGIMASISDPNTGPFGGIEVSSSSGLAYGWSNSEGSWLNAFTLNADGSVVNYSGSSLASVLLPNFPNKNLVISTDGSQIVTPAGTVYTSAALTFVAQLQPLIDDMCFLTDGSSVALQGETLTLYKSGTYDELGQVTISGGAERLFANGTNAFAFAPPSTQGGSISVSEVTQAQLVAGVRTPLAGLSASASAAISTAPDDAFYGSDGNVYLLSRPTGNILRWSSLTDSYLSSIPLTGYPIAFSYSSVLNRIYISYPDDRITKIDLSTSFSEVPFSVADGSIECILAADSQLFVLASTFTSGTDAFLYNSNGSITAQEGAYTFDLSPYWNSSLQEIASFAPQNSDELQNFSVAGGTFGTPVTSAYGLVPIPTDPFRFSPDGSTFVAGDGELYNSTSFDVTESLGNSPVDAAWIGSTIFSITQSTSGTELDEWTSPEYLLVATTQLIGQPLRLWALSGGGLLAMTEQPSGPVFTHLNSSGNILDQHANAGTPFQPIDVTVNPIDTIVSAGGTATLGVTAQGTDLTYQWINETTNQVVGTGSSLVISNATDADAAEYSVTITGFAGSTLSESAAILLPILPVITNQPTGGTVGPGGAVDLFVSATSFPAATYQWYVNDSPVSGANSTVLYVGPLPYFSGGGTYTVKVSNQFGSVTSNPAVVTIGQPVQISTQPASQTVVAGGNVNLSVTATGNPSPTYQWYFNGAAISGATSSTLSMPEVPATAAGAYTVAVSDQDDSVTSSTAALTVTGAPFDINGDGMPDVFWTNTSTNDRGAYLMNGTSITGWAGFGTVPSQWRIGAVADFTGNGNDDILWQNTSTGECGFYMMHGTAVTGWVELGVVPTQWRIAGAADFTGTGNTDILWQNTATGESGIYMMNGTTVTGWVDLGNVPTQWRIVGAADFSGNGSRDILWQNTATGVCGFYLMSGTTVTGWSSLGTVPSGWRAAEVADFSGYGQPDILWQNTTTGACGFYKMTGLTVTGWVGLGTAPAGWQIMP